MATVTFPVGLGGDGSTVDDTSSPTTGLRAGGHRTRFVPALAQMVAVASGGVSQTAANVAAAAAQVTLADAAAASALNAPGTSATSTTSLMLSAGSKTFTIQTGKLFSIGQTMVAASAANPVNQMSGIVTAFNSGTGSLTLLIDNVSGTGTYADWTLSLSGKAAAAPVSSLASDLSRLMLTIADLNGRSLGTPNGVADPLEETTGVDAAGSTNEAYDAVSDLYANRTPGGLDWLIASTPSGQIGNDDPGGVASDGSRWVSVHASGKVWRSGVLDATGSWTNTATLTGAQNDIVWTGTVYISVGAAGYIATSPDGVTWTPRTSGTAQDLRGVIWAGTQAVTFGNVGTILTSPDGVTWTSRTSGHTNTIGAMAWSGTSLVHACGAVSNQVWRSTNAGVSWSGVSVTSGLTAPALSSNQSIIAVGSVFLCVVSAAAKIWRSTDDGATFTEITATSLANNKWSILNNGLQWVALGGATTPVVQYSTDNGSTWTSGTSNDTGTYSRGTATASNGTIVSLSNVGKVHYSVGPQNAMDLRSVAYTALSVPGSASLMVMAKGGSPITINTHLIGYVSRDNGTTWHTVTLVQRETLSDGFIMYDAYNFSIGTLPSGTSMKWRLATTASFIVEVSAVYFGWA